MGRVFLWTSEVFTCLERCDPGWGGLSWGKSCSAEKSWLIKTQLFFQCHPRDKQLARHKISLVLPGERRNVKICGPSLTKAIISRMSLRWVMGLFEDFNLPVVGLLSFFLLEKHIQPVLLLWIHFQRTETYHSPPSRKVKRPITCLSSPSTHSLRGDFRLCSDGGLLGGGTSRTIRLKQL